MKYKIIDKATGKELDYSKYGLTYAGDVICYTNMLVLLNKQDFIIEITLDYKYPIDGQLPENDNLVFAYYNYGIPELAKYDLRLQSWFDREHNQLKSPKKWCELPIFH